METCGKLPHVFSGGADLAGEPGAPTGAGSLPADYFAVGLRACSACAGEYEDLTSRRELRSPTRAIKRSWKGFLCDATEL
jgi:hypothetical protein